MSCCDAVQVHQGAPNLPVVGADVLHVSKHISISLIIFLSILLIYIDDVTHHNTQLLLFLSIIFTLMTSRVQPRL